MRFMNIQNYPIGLAHLVWRDAGFDIMSVQRAGWKVRLMSGTDMLQATRTRFISMGWIQRACYVATNQKILIIFA